MMFGDDYIGRNIGMIRRDSKFQIPNSRLVMVGILNFESGNLNLESGIDS